MEAPDSPKKVPVGWQYLLTVLVFYFIFGFAYQYTIYYTSGGDSDFIWQVHLDYLLKGALTLPIWLLMFRWLSHWALWKRVTLHLFLMPAWVFIWVNVYYEVCDRIGLWHLGGPGTGWDVYIPALFYLIQFGAYHLHELYHRQRAQFEKEAELRQLVLGSELAALKAQLNPHFLYNTFNTINASVPAGQEHTRELIANLADMFRYQLKASREQTVPLREELEFVKTYLKLEKARFGERLETKIQVPDALLDQAVPPLLLQPLIENSIAHGIAPLIEGGKVGVKIQQEGEELRFQVCDTGAGEVDKVKAATGGVGLANTRKRLRLGFERELSIQANEPRGICIAFHLPLTSLNLTNG